jgi:hypothetical protein
VNACGDPDPSPPRFDENPTSAAGLRSTGVPDMDAVGRLVVELAADEEYLAPLIAQIPAESLGVVLGTGPSPYSLILLGDDMLLLEREEYDPDQGAWRGLAPGDPGAAGSPRRG